MNDLEIELTGKITGEVWLKQDKNGKDYYHGRIECDDGNHAFFFFKFDYELATRLQELKDGDEITVKGTWGKRSPPVLIATSFYKEGKEEENDIFNGKEEENE